MLKTVFFILLTLLFCQCKPSVDYSPIQFAGKPEVPSSIKETHVHILEQIHLMTLSDDSAARVAIKLEEMMQHHFKEEEDFVLPLLGLLPMLADGQMPTQAKEILALGEKVKINLNHMSAEHQLIKAYIEELKQATSKAELFKIIEFENEVVKHAISEEEVFFPTAILVAEYLKLKSNNQ